MKAYISPRLRKVLDDPKTREEFWAWVLGSEEPNVKIKTKDGETEEFHLNR